MASIHNYESTTYVVIEGKKMTMQEYRKYKKEKDLLIQSKLSKKKQAEIKRVKKATKKKRETEITVLPGIVKSIVSNAGPIKSLAAYYDNAYRQWGTIATSIIKLPEIDEPFRLFRVDAYQIVDAIKEIAEVAKGNEKAVFQYVQKLSWRLDNARNKMKILYSGVITSGALEQFKDKECINGEGRRLGLRVLMTRTFKSLDSIEAAIDELNRIAKEGLDVFEYRTDVLERAYRTV